MLYRTIPKSDQKISILGISCTRFPVRDNGTILMDRALELLHSAVDEGINYIDTAYTYHDGQSEPLIGTFLHEIEREKVIIASKLPTWLISSRSDMDRILETQLERLGTDHIDFYLLHALTGSRWYHLEPEGVLDFLDDAISDGRIGYAGFSFYDGIVLFKEIIDSFDWDICQIQYSFLDEDFKAGTEGLRYAFSKNIGVIARDPFRDGAFIRNMPPKARQIWKDSHITRNPARLAMEWVWDHPEVTAITCGISSQKQLSSAIRSASSAYPYFLSDFELHSLEQIREVYSERITINCNGCGFCMPCINGVNIPGCIDHYNKAFVFGDVEEAGRTYKILIPEEARASRCIGCAECEQVCPMKLPIREKLGEITELFEGR
jgi:predicted aldo/keto reductase-like oxidoreductase